MSLTVLVAPSVARQPFRDQNDHHDLRATRATGTGTGTGTGTPI